MSSTSRKLQSSVAIVAITISLCASTGWSDTDYVHVHMTNHLGNATIVQLHCAQNGAELGHQEIPDQSTGEWKFEEFVYPPNELQCVASVPGANPLQFVAYDVRTDSCYDDCHWNFTSHGVYKYENGPWDLKYTWPH